MPNREPSLVALLAAVVMLFAEVPLTAQVLYWIDGGEIVRDDVATGVITTVHSGPTAFTLAVDGDSGDLFWFQAPFALMTSDLDGSGSVELLSYPFGFDALTANPATQRVYWINTFNGQFVSAGYDGLAPDVIGGMFWMSGAGVDTVDGKFYYTLDTPGELQRMDFDGSAQETVLAGLDGPEDCRYDEADGMAYWRTAGGDVQRCTSAGTALETVISGVDVPGITNLVVDPVQGFLYVSTSAGEIWRTGLDGSAPEAIYTAGGDITELSIIPGAASPGPLFVRGDLNVDGVFDISDPVSLLSILFIFGTPPAPCEDAVDGNDDGAVDLSDAVYLLSALFVVGAPPPPPPAACGLDPTPDPLGCDSFSACP